MPKIKEQLTPEQREFQRIKRFVIKRFPGAHTMQKEEGTYVIVDGDGFEVRSQELMLPYATSVREAWNQAKFGNWWDNMIRKSTNAFSDEKIYKKLAKESRD